MMKIAVKNFIGISRAEIDLDGAGIALIGGDNAVGKSSVIKGVQALLTGVLTPKGIAKNAQALVSDGKKTGELRLATPDGDVAIDYPDPQYATRGKAPTASALAAGLVRYTELSDAERSVFLTQLLQATPSKEKLQRALADDLELPEDAVEHISGEVEKNGWDEAVAMLTERRVKLKGRWEQVTGERWGDKKALEWLPDGWNLGEVEDGEQLTARVASCQEAFNRANKADAMSEAEHKALRELAGKREPTALTLQTARLQLPSIEEAWAKLRRELDALPPAVEDEGIPCPHCGAHVHVRSIIGANGTYFLLDAVEPMLEGEVERRKRKIAEKRDEVREAMQRLEAQQQLVGAAEEKLRLIEAAEQKLKGGTVGNGNAGAKAAALALQLEEAKRARDMWNQRQQAQELQVRVEVHQAVIDLLGPKGMRRTALLDALAAFERDSLDPLTKDTETWKTITIDRDSLLPLFGGRPYSLLSKSEQYRTDVTLQIAIALLEGAAMVCLDGADILSPNGQDDLFFGLLDKLPFPALVGATYGRAKACPKLEGAGIGHSYWVNAGKLVPLAEALA